MTSEVGDTRRAPGYRRPPMSTTAPTARTATVGELLRDWRRRRRLSQLDLSLEAAVSARHLSFVETGRSRPGRDLLLHLAEHLEVPLRERNRLLLAAGYAPVYPERSLDDAAMEPVRAALDTILAGHAPFPALIVDRRWDLVAANGPALFILAEGVDPALLEPPANVVRVSLHPDGLAPRIRNFAEFSEHAVTRLRRQALLAGDGALDALLAEIRGFPGVAEDASMAPDPARMLFVPMELERPDGTVLRLFSTIAVFGTALDVTVSELAIETFFPADPATAAALHAAAPGDERDG